MASPCTLFGVGRSLIRGGGRGAQPRFAVVSIALLYSIAMKTTGGGDAFAYFCHDKSNSPLTSGCFYFQPHFAMVDCGELRGPLPEEVAGASKGPPYERGGNRRACGREWGGHVSRGKGRLHDS